MAVMLVWLLFVAALDLRTKSIPNILTLGGMVVGVCILLSTGQSLTLASMQSVVCALLIVLLLTLPAYIYKLVGAGDVKLLVAIALLCGLQLTLQTYVLASIGLAITALTIGILRKLSSKQVQQAKRSLPFGAALAITLILILAFPDHMGTNYWGIDALLFS